MVCHNGLCVDRCIDYTEICLCAYEYMHIFHYYQLLNYTCIQMYYTTYVAVLGLCIHIMTIVWHSITMAYLISGAEIHW